MAQNNKTENLIKRLERQINKAPTGELRNLLTDLNIYIQAQEEVIKKLQHHKDTTVGLYATDKDPKTVSYEWLIENNFQIQFRNDDFPEDEFISENQNIV